MEQEKKIILKVLVGSRGYGIYDDDADYDYRGVYVLPTRRILSLGYRYKGTHWIEEESIGAIDDTSYELGHFLQLASKCNPTILNTLKAPVVETNSWGLKLRKLFSCFIDPKRMYDAFVGYGLNQRKKMLDNKDNRWKKYGAAYLRQLYYLYCYFTTGDYDFMISKGAKIEHNLMIHQTIEGIKRGSYSTGWIIDLATEIKNIIDRNIEEEGYSTSTADSDKVNKFLLHVRKEFW